MANYLATTWGFSYQPDFVTAIVNVGHTFTGIGTTGNAQGTLQYYDDTGTWVALAGKSVKLTRPDTTFVSVVTDASGVANFVGEIAQRGTYTLDYAGGAV